MERVGDEGPLPDPRVLGWLLATQNVLQIMDGGKQLAEFVSRALSDVPGVSLCRLFLAGRDEQAPSASADLGEIVHFSLETSNDEYGRLLIHLEDREAFAAYEPFIGNFAGSLALLLENRRQKSRLEEALEQVKVSESRYRRLFSEMSSGLAVHEIILDDEGHPCDYRFLEVNRAFEELTGLMAGDVVGRGIVEILPELEASWIERFGRVALHGESICFEDYNRDLDRHYEVTAYQPQPAQFAAVFTDVSERKCLERKLEEASRRLAATNQELVTQNTLLRRQSEELLSRQAELLDSNRRLELVSGTAARLLASGRPKQIVVGLCWEVMRHLDCQVFFNYLVDEEIGRLRLNACSGISDDAARRLEWLDFGQALCGWVAREGVQRAEEDIQHSQEQLTEVVRSLGIQAYAAQPLTVNDQVIGTLSFGSRTRIGFSPDDLSLMQVIANQVAVAVERERSRAALEESETRFRSMAERLQSALLDIPQEIGRLQLSHLYRSATEMAKVGGDFYDAFEVGGKKIAILMGDVAGHGIEAARTATLVKDVVHAFAHQSLGPIEILERVNQLLMAKRLSGFVTLFLGILDPEAGVLTYESAGHPEALLKRRSGEVEALGSGTVPVGVVHDPGWNVHKTELMAGDILVLYTDGIIEARRGGEPFGEESLRKLLEAYAEELQRLPSFILDSVLDFSGDVLSDDAAILVFALQPHAAVGCSSTE
jgi:PAS domain S-box-containing protein